MDVATRQEIEIAFWKNSKEESPEADSVFNLVNKMAEAGVDEIKNRGEKIQDVN